jgi:two-component sensor histidine kinase
MPEELLHRLRHLERDRFFEFQRQMRSLVAVIRGITRRSSITPRSAEEFAAHLEGRIDALARVHGMLMRLPDAHADLAELVSGEFLAQAAPEDVVQIAGPQVTLSNQTAASLALALHELTTNSVKFGALGTPGRLSVIWSIEPDGTSVRLDWRESGVALLQAPTHRGFGVELIERSLPYEIGARTELAFLADGLHCAIVFQP